jgi:5-methylcytosine-specific restriction protein A
MTSDTYCAKHAPLHTYIDNRDSAPDRGYDAKWKTVRDRYLRRHPLCMRCAAQGRTTLASVVHHVWAISDGGPRLDVGNLQALCRDCHEITHGRKAEHKAWDETG